MSTHHPPRIRASFLWRLLLRSFPYPSPVLSPNRCSCSGFSNPVSFSNFPTLPLPFVHALLSLWVSPTQMLGLASVRCELLLSTVLFLSREGPRLALAREPWDRSTDPVRFRAALNLAFVPVAVGFCLSVVVAAGQADLETLASRKRCLFVCLLELGVCVDVCAFQT